jgi:hypothetical protein
VFNLDETIQVEYTYLSSSAKPRVILFKSRAFVKVHCAVCSRSAPDFRLIECDSHSTISAGFLRSTETLQNNLDALITNRLLSVWTSGYALSQVQNLPCGIKHILSKNKCQIRCQLNEHFYPGTELWLSKISFWHSLEIDSRRLRNK